MQAPHKCSVVILGAGFGGLAAAKEFAHCCEGGLAKVTVIDRSPFHTFTPLLYEAATAFVEHENLGTSQLLRSGVAVDAAELLASWRCDFLQDEVLGIDWDARQVRVKSGAAVPFDHLIIAMGAEVNFFGISGLKEHAYILKNAHDADKLRQRLHDLLHKKEAGRQDSFEIVIGGGGATGVELAAELTMFLRQHMRKGHLGPRDFRISIVEASPRLLGAMSPEVSALTLDRLHALGVHVYLDTAIKEAGMSHVALVPRACKAGETPDQLQCEFTGLGSKDVRADITVWCGGIRGSSSLEALGLPLDERGKRIPVGVGMEIAGKQDAYAIGDCTLLMNPASKMPAPWLAQAAMRQGRVAAGRIIHKVKGGAMPEYAFPVFPVVVPLGGKFCVAVAFGRTWSGFAGWLIHEIATLRYFMSIMRPLRAVQYWWKGARMYAGND